jgi:hypothetical protein
VLLQVRLNHRFLRLFFVLLCFCFFETFFLVFVLSCFYSILVLFAVCVLNLWQTRAVNIKTAVDSNAVDKELLLTLATGSTTLHIRKAAAADEHGVGDMNCALVQIPTSSADVATVLVGKNAEVVVGDTFAVSSRMAQVSFLEWRPVARIRVNLICLAAGL